MTPIRTLVWSLAVLGLGCMATTAQNGLADGPRIVPSETQAVWVPENAPKPATEPETGSLERVERAAAATKPAVRLTPPTTSTAPAPTGLGGRPFAPKGLDECAEMEFYRKQFGLPERFGTGGGHQLWVASDGLGWRESKCKNYVNTWCCYGYWQLHINLFLKDWRLGPLLRNECKVEGVSDIFGTTPLQKQKQACAARKTYDVSGYEPWRPLS